MAQVDAKDIWRQIPPEEKFLLMSRAQAKGVLACIVMIVTACTVAVGLRQSWIMWGSFILAPFVFQFSAGKAWRSLRPTVMLEYLAARAAARRYAFAANSKDLYLSLIFKGLARSHFDSDDKELRELEAAIENTAKAAVWVALFNDAVVLMSEQAGGARLEFAHLLNDRLEISGQSPSNSGEYTNDREVMLSYTDRKSGEVRRISITSHYPAALIVFEKKIQALKNEVKAKESLMAAQELEYAQNKDSDDDLMGAY